MGCWIVESRDCWLVWIFWWLAGVPLVGELWMVVGRGWLLWLVVALVGAAGYWMLASCCRLLAAHWLPVVVAGCWLLVVQVLVVLMGVVVLDWVCEWKVLSGV